MDRIGFAVLLFALLGSSSAFAERRDTLFSANQDRVIVSWEVVREGNRCTIRFNDVRKKLGRRNGERYKRLDEIAVLFFDRTGNYNGVTFSNLIPEAFMVPARVGYEKSEDGYFLLDGQENPVLTFDVGGEAGTELSIPIYLARYEGKRKYRVFERCGPLLVRLDKPTGGAGADAVPSEVRTVVSSVVQEEDNREITDMLTRISMVRTLLAEQTKLPFTDGLQYEISSLRIKKEQVANPELLDRINEVLLACETKRMELEAADERILQQKQEEAERAAREEREEARIREEQQQEQQRQEAAAAKKRNFWMIVGGAVLAVLCFAGNQLMQHLRNRMNQRSMMEMQQSMVRQAESEAKRNARRVVQQKARQAGKRLSDAAGPGRLRGSNSKKKNISI